MNASSQPYLTSTQRFAAAVIEEAGSPERLAIDLARLGHGGRHGAYSVRSIRTWRSGARTPGADIVFALARRYRISFDQFTQEGQ